MFLVPLSVELTVELSKQLVNQRLKVDSWADDRSSGAFAVCSRVGWRQQASRISGSQKIFQ